MDNRSNEEIKAMIAENVSYIYKQYEDVKNSINDNLKDSLDFMKNLLAQIPQSASRPLIAKTPKVPKKKAVQHIETIPEGEVVSDDRTSQYSEKNTIEDNETRSGRPTRRASKRALSNIREQTSPGVTKKMSKTIKVEMDITDTFKKPPTRQSKRAKNSNGSSDEDGITRPSKQSKREEDEQEASNKLSLDVTKDLYKPAVGEPRRSGRNASSKRSNASTGKTSNAADDTLVSCAPDDVEELSMYEDAMSKPVPVTNSTMKLNSTVNLERMMNATVVLQPLSMQPKLNETVTIAKKSAERISAVRDRETGVERVDGQQNKPRTVPSPRLEKVPSKEGLLDRMRKIKEAVANGDIDELMTDDESSPEVKKFKGFAKMAQEESKVRKAKATSTRQKRKSRTSSSSEDEVISTPVRTVLKEKNARQDLKSSYKTGALFSPYAKDSVKKRVEAFEQAGINSPRSVAIDAPTRVTRTKTRALAAAKAEEEENNDNAKYRDKTVAQKLARKSLARAKKISLAREARDNDGCKENDAQSQKPNKIPAPEKSSQKQQLRTTPSGKSRTQLPVSVNRMYHTPSNSQHVTSHVKAMTASRSNIVSSVDSFIQAPKTASKLNSVDREKRGRINEEDARRKRDEALRLMTEEKKRKREQKELRNKLAREAKEREVMEKRLRAEREREEKAKYAQQMHDKHLEELERKRLAQLQRVQETEERRRVEKQRLLEQEESNRRLAEEVRRVQEYERAKAQMKQQDKKNQYPTSYVLDSAPDDDETDDESRPKHMIPLWARSHVRRKALTLQRFIHQAAVFRFFDTRKCTPDLTEMFHGIDRSRLKRTSSAIWKSPPRYSMMEGEG